MQMLQGALCRGILKAEIHKGGNEYEVFWVSFFPEMYDSEAEKFLLFLLLPTKVMSALSFDLVWEFDNANCFV